MIRVYGNGLAVDINPDVDPRIAAEMRDVLLIQHALTRAMLGDTDVVVKAVIPARLHSRYDAAVAILRTAV